MKDGPTVEMGDPLEVRNGIDRGWAAYGG